MGRLDAIPADDIALQRTISHFYRAGEKDIIRRSQGNCQFVGSWRVLAGYYLNVAELMNIKI